VPFAYILQITLDGLPQSRSINTLLGRTGYGLFVV